MRLELPEGITRVTDPDTLLVTEPGSIVGQGIGVSILALTGPAAQGIRIQKRRIGAVTLKDFTITTDRPRAFAVQAKEKVLFAGNRGHSAELIVENVEARPEDGCEWSAAFARAFDLDRLGWPILRNVVVCGRFQDNQMDSWADPDAMRVAIDLGGCQEAKLSNIYVHGANEGVRVHCQGSGEGEGFSLTQSTIINCFVPVAVYGEKPGVWGGWATPWATISHSHLFGLGAMVTAFNRNGVKVVFNDLCVSHYAKGTPIGVYMSASHDSTILGNTFWNTGEVPSIGLLADACIRGRVNSNIFDPSVATNTIISSVNGPSTEWRNDELSGATKRATQKSRRRDIELVETAERALRF